MLHLNRTTFALVAAVALVMGLGAPTVAQEEPTTFDSVQVTLAGGVLSFTIEVQTQLSQIRYSHADGYTVATGGSFDVVVKDDRNNAAGYVIDLAASDFLREGSAHSIDLGVNGTTLAVGAASTVVKDAGPGSAPNASEVLSLTESPRPILAAGSGVGNGHFTAAGYSLTLSGVSASTPPGNYVSVLTLSSAAGPQG